MTRRRQKVRPKRKVRKPAKPAKPARREPLDDFIAAGAQALKLKIEKPWMPAVRSHLQVTLRHGALVTAFALDDDAEPAPVFQA